MRETREQRIAAVFGALKPIHAELKALALEESAHGYGSIGSALDKMERKAKVLTQDCYTLTKLGFASGSQRIGG